MKKGKISDWQFLISLKHYLKVLASLMDAALIGFVMKIVNFEVVLLNKKYNIISMKILLVSVNTNNDLIELNYIKLIKILVR